MFNGSWLEREHKFISIEIIDPRITIEGKHDRDSVRSSPLIFCFLSFIALHTVFGSLYLDEVTLEPRTVVSVLAAAALLQLDGLIEKCCEVMSSTINAEVRKSIEMNRFSKQLIVYYDFVTIFYCYIVSSH